MTDARQVGKGRSGEDSAVTEAAVREAAPGAQRIHVTTPAGLLAAIPHLLGFHPANSLVVIGTRPSSRKVAVTMRYDLPDPPDPRLAAQIARHAAAVLAAGHAEEAVVVGYGPDELVTTIVGKLQAHKTPRLPLTEILRVADGRYWSYRYAEPRCCPTEGTPFDPAAEPADATLAAEGPVLGSRDEVAATVAPVGGKTAGVMRRATAQAEQRAAELLARPTPDGTGISIRSGIALAGVEAVAQAVARYRGGGQLSAGNDAAWLTLALRDLQVRDDAWSRMLPEHRKAHLRLWLDLTRLAQPGYVATPASLLALIAWQSGNGTLANVALDRALADVPTYQMARLLRLAVLSGAPPTAAGPPMTPDEVAAYYDGAGAQGFG